MSTRMYYVYTAIILLYVHEKSKCFLPGNRAAVGRIQARHHRGDATKIARINPTFAFGQKMAWQNGDAALPGGFSKAKAV